MKKIVFWLLMVTFTSGYSQVNPLSKLDSAFFSQKLNTGWTTAGWTEVRVDTMQCIMQVSDNFPSMEFNQLYTRPGYVIRQRYSGSILGYLNMSKKPFGDSISVWDYKVWLWKK